MRPLLLFISLFLLVFAACEKEQNNKLLNPYFKYEINGTASNFQPADLFNNNLFNCVTKGDSILQVNVSKLYEGAGFYIKTTNLKDGTYELNDINKAYYTNPKDMKRYNTTAGYKGTITINRGTFQAKSLLNTMHATFSFTAIDTATNKSFNVLNGEFLMELDAQ